uniref:Ig-like domain-containing protein n=1 Tax=Heliothis virescens TaxID=7102 RepID=A0A2A4K0P8_HELVI
MAFRITPHPRKGPKPKEPTGEAEYDIFQGLKALKNLQLPDPCPEAKKKKGSLLNKLVSKMGIKVVSGKKKVAKKPSIREIVKKKNAKRKRKLRVNNAKPESSIADLSERREATEHMSKQLFFFPRSAQKISGIVFPEFNTRALFQEACDSRRSPDPSQTCDIQATLDHITALQNKVSKEDFEALVRNITCFKYKPVDSGFFVPYKRQGKRWDWIRNKRCLKLHFARVKEESDFDDEVDVVEFGQESDSFDKFVKGDDGIYKIVTRKKRTACLKDLEVGLRNIPSLMPGKNEMYVMVGDTVTLDCVPTATVPESDGKYSWKTDRKRMLKHDNVQVEGVKLTINNVEPRNVGTYTCSLDQTVQRNLRLVVMTIPAFDVVFLPIYKTEDTCSYDDLKAIQSLGGMMSEANRCGKACSVRIDEPVCQRDRGTNISLLRTMGVISMTPLNFNCSMQCRRDIASSLVMLCATNTPVLSSIGIVMSKDGVNSTLTPWAQFVRPVVTHSLRKKDTNGHKEYHKLVSTLAPGKVDVVLNCPAGFYLLRDYKLCSSCPANTHSLRGDNMCTRCPRGTHAPPGAEECLAAAQPRRYDWWWYPPCGYFVACCGVVLGCTICLVLSIIVHFVSKRHENAERSSSTRERLNTPKTGTSVTATFAHVILAPHSRPLSPSRVILPRFFKPSLTSSRATDSQETKFELWKERNKPPPLPPIDFDF